VNPRGGRQEAACSVQTYVVSRKRVALKLRGEGERRKITTSQITWVSATENRDCHDNGAISW